ncbi:hypothetical protein ACJ73_08554 [Blastomyces percursus]|uniref:Uncharacterized protein n=1 Tax=Blastomyces percursus TaxID=1658174 RepID=A0A1J9PUP0_9EURO|nr:hypothetical protein ACJ73_08554 [Blastomyces percursus]
MKDFDISFVTGFLSHFSKYTALGLEFRSVLRVRTGKATREGG